MQYLIRIRNSKCTLIDFGEYTVRKSAYIAYEEAVVDIKLGRNLNSRVTGEIEYIGHVELLKVYADGSAKLVKQY